MCKEVEIDIEWYSFKIILVYNFKEFFYCIFDIRVVNKKFFVGLNYFIVVKLCSVVYEYFYYCCFIFNYYCYRRFLYLFFNFDVLKDRS